MSNLHHLKKRVQLIRNSKKVTNALQMMAITKMKKARNLLQQIHSYSEHVLEFMQKIATQATHQELNQDVKRFFEPARKSNHSLVVLFAPTKGVCGALISSINAFLNDFIKQSKHKIRSVGLQSKSRFILESLNDLVIDAIFENPVSDETRFELEAEFQYILKGYLAGEYENVNLIYPKFISVFKYKIVQEQLLPLNKHAFNKIFQDNQIIAKKDEATLNLPPKELSSLNDQTYVCMEPSVNILFKEALERYLINRLTYATVNTKASEFSARSIAMKSATENAESLEQVLQLEFNKMRQQAITSNLLDIIGALLK